MLNHMRNKLSDYQEMYGDLYNLEATPAESTSYRFARHDKEKYPDIITASEGKTPYYTNSSNLPVGFTEDIFEALDIQDDIQTLYTSGTVFHAFLGQKLSDWKTTANLVRTIAENYRLPYYTISPTYSVCKNHGYIAGEVYKCPECGETTEVYSRITGYYRPVANWNDGKSQEFEDRKVYDLGASHLEGHIHNHDKCVCDDKKCVGNEIMLFTTKTCPNCKMAKMLLDKAGIKYTVIDAEDEKETTRNFNVTKAPTMLVPNGEKYARFDNVSDISKFIDSQKVKK